ncbi:MAG: hypothetical protein V5A61_13530 [Haloarculaceae archaeon]
MDDADASGGSERSYRPLLGIGGALSLCCLVAAPATTGAAGGVAGGGVVAVFGGSLVQVLTTALTVGLLGVLVRVRSGDDARDA